MGITNGVLPVFEAERIPGGGAAVEADVDLASADRESAKMDILLRVRPRGRYSEFY